MTQNLDKDDATELEVLTLEQYAFLAYMGKEFLGELTPTLIFCALILVWDKKEILALG